MFLCAMHLKSPIIMKQPKNLMLCSHPIFQIGPKIGCSTKSGTDMTDLRVGLPLDVA